MSKIYIYDTKYEGEDAQAKIARVREQMGESLKTFVPEEVCWLLNLRGSGAGEEFADDVKKFSPVFVCGLAPLRPAGSLASKSGSHHRHKKQY